MYFSLFRGPYYLTPVVILIGVSVYLTFISGVVNSTMIMQFIIINPRSTLQYVSGQHLKNKSAKYEFASSITTRTTFAFDACFVWKLAPPTDERNGFFHRISIKTIDVIEHVFNVANSYLACGRENKSPLQGAVYIIISLLMSPLLGTGDIMDYT
jgi:hypothetical protein